MKKLVSGLMMLVGAVLLIGTAGASDSELISLTAVVVQGSIACTLLLVGGKLGGIFNA